MSFARKIKRRHMLKTRKETYGRTTCPRCHDKLVEKYGYGLVCANCGWQKSADETDHQTEKGGGDNA